MGSVGGISVPRGLSDIRYSPPPCAVYDISPPEVPPALQIPPEIIIVRPEAPRALPIVALQPLPSSLSPRVPTGLRCITAFTVRPLTSLDSLRTYLRMPPDVVTVVPAVHCADFLNTPAQGALVTTTPFAQP